MRSGVKRMALLSTFVLLVCGSPRLADAQVVRIAFDQGPDGSAVASGTPVNTLYSEWGVTFDAVRCPSCGTDPNVYAVGGCRDYLPISSPNVVSLWASDNCTPTTERLGLVQATFAVPADSVCLLVMPVRLGEQAVVRAYNAAGVEVATAYSTPSVTGTVCLRAPAIVRVTFAGAFLGHAWFDEFVVHLVGVTPTRRHSWGSLKSIYR